MTRRALLIAVLLALCVSVGCAGNTAAVRENPSSGSALTRGLWRVACFLPDRLLDGADIVSLTLGVGYGFDLHRHLTYYCHVPSLGWYKSWDISWRYGRRLGFVQTEESEAGVVNMYFHETSFAGWGPGWENGRMHTFATAMDVKPTEAEIFKQKFRDRWAVGITYGPFIAGPRIGFVLHPVELADLLVGTVTLGIIDIGHDDWAMRK